MTVYFFICELTVVSNKMIHLKCISSSIKFSTCKNIRYLSETVKQNKQFGGKFRSHPLYEVPTRTLALSFTFPLVNETITLSKISRVISKLKGNIELSRGCAAGTFSFIRFYYKFKAHFFGGMVLLLFPKLSQRSN